MAELLPPQLQKRLRDHAARLVSDLEIADGNEKIEAALLESAAILKDAANELEKPEMDLEP